MKMPARPTRQKRLHILSDDEREALYGRPRFTPEERLEYFTLSPIEQAALAPFHSIKSRIYGILQLGYFNSTLANEAANGTPVSKSSKASRGNCTNSGA
jgi:Domain of unknown function (DUF4158)